MSASPWLLLAALLAAPALQAAEPADDPVAKSVVRIFTTFRRPDYYQPWQMAPEDGLSGSGCVIAGRRILTNAHVVADQVFVQVRKAGDPMRYTAKVEFIANDSELALLKVDDEAFFRDVPALELGAMPQRRDKVAVYGFPDGGDDLSVTEGIVSRVEVTEYAHSDRQFLTVQTDAAINPGNSGGPMIRDGKLVGIAFQLDPQARSVGYAVPAPLIARFLEDIGDGRYDGVPDLGIRWESTENRAKRDFLGLKPGVTGVRVSTVVYGSSAWGLLRTGDLVTAIDGTPVFDDGTVPFRKNERVLLSSLIDIRQIGQKVSLNVLRDGRSTSLSVPLKAFRALVPGPAYGVRATYYVFAGLVFTPLTLDYIDTWSAAEIPTHLKAFLEYGLPSPERQEVVVLSHVLPHAVNAGYHELRDVVIEKANGRRIARLEDLVEALRAPLGKFHVLQTDSATDFGSLIILDAARAERASEEILSRYGIPADRSADLRRP